MPARLSNLCSCPLRRENAITGTNGNILSPFFTYTISPATIRPTYDCTRLLESKKIPVFSGNYANPLSAFGLRISITRLFLVIYVDSFFPFRYNFIMGYLV